MSIADLIRSKNEKVAVATAIPAIPATTRTSEGRTVARIATVAVANPSEEKTKVGEATAIAPFRLWRIKHPEGCFESSFSPTVTRAQVAAFYPGLEIESVSPEAASDSGVLTASPVRPAIPPDDRRTCRQCLNLARSGLCLASHRGELHWTSRDNRPPTERLYRCVGYQPGADDEDRRPGLERWPFLARVETDDSESF